MKRILTILFFLCALASAHAAEYIRMEPECVSRKYTGFDWRGNYTYSSMNNTVSFVVENAQVGEFYELRRNNEVLALTADATTPTIYRSVNKTIASGTGTGVIATYQLYKNGVYTGVYYNVNVCDANCPTVDDFPHALLSTKCQMTTAEYFEQMGNYMPTSNTFTVTRGNLKYGENGTESFGTDNDLFLDRDEAPSPRYVWIVSPTGQKICRRDFQYERFFVKHTPYVRGCPVMDDIVYNISQNSCAFYKNSVSINENTKTLSICGNSATLKYNGFNAPYEMPAGVYLVQWKVIAVGDKDYDCPQKVIIKAPDFDCISPEKMTLNPDYGFCEKQVTMNLPDTKNTNCIKLEWSRTGYSNDYHVVDRYNVNSYTDAFYPSPNTYKIYWRVTLGEEVKECVSQVELKPLSVSCKNYSYLADGAITIPYPDVTPSHETNWTEIKITAKGGSNVAYTRTIDGINAEFPLGESTIKFQTTLCKVKNEVDCPVFIIKKAEPCE